MDSSPYLIMYSTCTHIILTSSHMCVLTLHCLTHWVADTNDQCLLDMSINNNNNNIYLKSNIQCT